MQILKIIVLVCIIILVVYFALKKWNNFSKYGGHHKVMMIVIFPRFERLVQAVSVLLQWTTLDSVMKKYSSCHWTKALRCLHYKYNQTSSKNKIPWNQFQENFREINFTEKAYLMFFCTDFSLVYCSSRWVQLKCGRYALLPTFLMHYICYDSTTT